LLLVAVLLWGVPAAPAQAALGDFSIEDEAELGQKFNVLIRSRFPLIYDPIVLNQVQDILTRIRRNVPPQPFDVTVGVLRDDSINAFAAPAGYVFVNSGLILAMHSEDELAAVLAHEMAHVTERHLASNIERSQMINLATLAGVLAGVMLGGSEAGQALAVGSMAGGQTAALKYSRDDEREADHLGLQYLARSGYNAEAMAGAFERIKERMRLSGAGSRPAYMSTHPGVTERIGYVRAVAQRLQDEGAGRTSPSLRFRKVQTLIRARYTEARSAWNYFQQYEANPCLRRLGSGITAARLNRIDQAKELLSGEAPCREIGALWHREVGRFYFRLGRFDRALSHLDKALRKSPKDYMALFFQARILGEKGEIEEAVAGLEKVLSYVPQDPEVHRTLGRILGRSGDAFSGYLHYAYAALYRNRKEACSRYVDKVRELARTNAQEEKLERFEEKYEVRKKYW
jgi:predicted Zn-dependent protease